MTCIYMFWLKHSSICSVEPDGGEKIRPFVCDNQVAVDKSRKQVERRIRQMLIEILADKKKGNIFVTTLFVAKHPLLILHQK